MRTLVLFLTVLVAASPVPVSAQIHKKVVRTAGHMLDSLQRRFLTKVDTNYIGNYPRPWRLSAMYNASHYRGVAEDDGYSLYVSTKMTNRFSVGIGYQGLAFNYNYRMGSKKKSEMSIQAYGRRMGFELKFHGSDKLNLELVADDGQSISLVSEGNEFYSYVLDGYYAFNHRKFSYPAALAQSKIQKKSAGSLLAGISLSSMGVTMADVPEGDTESWSEVRLSLGLGYGYNWSFKGGKMLFHASWIPMLNLVDSDLTQAKGSSKYENKETDRYSLFNLVRLGLFYNFSDRIYAGFLVTDNPVPKREQGMFSMDNLLFSRATLTWRF